MVMTYYEVDESVLETEQRLAGSANLAGPLLEALHDLQEVRRDDCLPVAGWVTAVGDATRRTLDRIEAHARAGAAPGSVLNRLPNSCRRLQQELAAEHHDLFAGFRRQLALARAETPGKGLAIRLLDSLIARECDLALHINGLSRLLTAAEQRQLALASVRRGELV